MKNNEIAATTENFCHYDQRWLWDGIFHPTKKIPIPGYGNPGDFDLKSWDPHPGIFGDPRKSQKIPNFPKNFFFTLKINKNKNRDYPFSKPNFYTKIFFINF